jgi:hypothetical protein
MVNCGNSENYSWSAFEYDLNEPGTSLLMIKKMGEKEYSLHWLWASSNDSVNMFCRVSYEKIKSIKNDTLYVDHMTDFTLNSLKTSSGVDTKLPIDWSNTLKYSIIDSVLISTRRPIMEFVRYYSDSEIQSLLETQATWDGSSVEL